MNDHGLELWPQTSVNKIQSRTGRGTSKLKLLRLHISFVNRTPIRCGFCFAAKGYPLFYCLLILFGSLLKYSFCLLIITTTHITYITAISQVNVSIEIDRKSFKIPQNKSQLLQQVLL